MFRFIRFVFFTLVISAAETGVLRRVVGSADGEGDRKVAVLCVDSRGYILRIEPSAKADAVGRQVFSVDHEYVAFEPDRLGAHACDD